MYVDNTVHTPVPLEAYMGSQPNYVALINPGDLPVAIKVSKNGAEAVWPMDGTPGDFVLPPYMQQPIVIGMQTGSLITAIGITTDSVIVFATPVEYIS